MASEPYLQSVAYLPSCFLIIRSNVKIITHACRVVITRTLVVTCTRKCNILEALGTNCQTKMRVLKRCGVAIKYIGPRIRLPDL